MRDSLLSELKRFGTTTVTDPASLDDRASRISADVLVCYAQAYWNYGAEVSVALTVSRDQGELIRGKNYTGTARLGTNFAATSESYQKVLELAMDAMLQNALPDIVTAITTAPQLTTSRPRSPELAKASQPGPREPTDLEKRLQTLRVSDSRT